METADSAGSRSAASMAPPALGEPAVRTLVAEWSSSNATTYSILHTDTLASSKHISISRRCSTSVSNFFPKSPYLSLSGIPKCFRFSVISLDPVLHRQFAYYIISTHRSFVSTVQSTIFYTAYLHISHYHYYCHIFGGKLNSALCPWEHLFL